MSRPRFAGLLLAVAAAARLVSLTWLHPLNWDEIEFFRATDWVRRGLVPYRDFWEHHTPLQWFLFAPISALTHSSGVAAVILLRWAQVPLWIGTFWLLFLWMRRAGIGLTARLSVIVLAVCSSMFMLAAVEYRIDSLGCALYVLALFLLQDADRRGWLAFAGGAALCLAGFANIRLGPLLALTALLMGIVRPDQHAWGGTKAATRIFAGVATAFTLCSAYFVATGTAAIAFRRVWTDNYLGDRLSEGTPWILLHRVAVPFGFQPLLQTDRLFYPTAFDVATVIIFVVGAIGVVRVMVANRRAPDHLFVLAFLQAGNVLFVTAMKFIYIYHFEIIILLMLPFVAAEIERFATERARWSIVAAGLLLVSASNLFASVFRGKEGDLAYQDLIMREVVRSTPATSTVFDGVGWALRRRPAYRYWFLPMLVVSLEDKGIFEPYSLKQVTADPPAAIISDYRAYGWLLTHRQTAEFAVRHYLPVWRNLWLPGLSARLTADSPSAEWVVPANGVYRVYASPRLSTHPWFRNPLMFGMFESAGVEISLTGFPPASRLPLAFTIDGKPQLPADTLVLQRLQRLRVVARTDQPLGLMIAPVEVRGLFQQPAAGVTIDGATMPVSHIPSLPDLFR